MTEQEIEIRFIRIGTVLRSMCEDVQPFLSGLDDVNSAGRASVMAFDLLERFYYHSQGILPLLPELGVNHNMAVPLSQIFRAMVYDAGISYWLFGESGVFETRMDHFNHSYVKKNTAKIEKFRTEHQMQELWKSWQALVQASFVEDSNGVLSLAKLEKNTHSTFELICEYLVQTHPESFIKSIPFIYAILSQQAHVSEFSKLIIYNRPNENLKTFDAICKIVLHTVLLLLDQISGSESIQAEIAHSLGYFYIKSVDDMKYKLA